MTEAEIEAAFEQIRKLAADHGVWRLKGSTWDHADRLQQHIASLRAAAAAAPLYCAVCGITLPQNPGTLDGYKVCNDCAPQRAGYVLVPLEATEAMWDAFMGHQTLASTRGAYPDWRDHQREWWGSGADFIEAFKRVLKAARSIEDERGEDDVRD